LQAKINNKQNMKRVIIIGGGFAGLKLALRLHHTKYEVLLIDRWNHHQFQPLFYQVATAGLEPSSVSFPLRSIFHHAKNIRFRLTEVQQVVPEQHKIITAIGEFTYDYLVLATGATTNFFGNKNFEANTFPMKTTSEAINIRQRMLMNFEDALNTTNEELESLMTFVITGGGPTGVELSGTLAEMRRHVFPKDYPELDFTKMKIILLEGSASTLGNMSEASQKNQNSTWKNSGVTGNGEYTVQRTMMENLWSLTTENGSALRWSYGPQELKGMSSKA
jgi:NADH dehydrogenase